jgi:hypothetical protein
MTRRADFLAVLALGLLLGGVQAEEPTRPSDKALNKLAQAKLDAARKTFESIWAAQTFQYVEIPYRWSRRWLEAQREVNPGREDQEAACRKHLQRMRELELLAQRQYQQQVIGLDQVNAARYYVVEAEEWLEQAKK